MAVLLSTAYFPPVEYFAAMAEEMVLSDDKTISSSVVWLEGQENFQKQSWRNRCRIYGAEGPQILSYPIVHEHGTHQLPISEIKIDYTVDWVTQHKRAIISAYRSSAYFEYYCDELFAILDSRPETLFELNLKLIRFFLEKTFISADLQVTDEFHIPASDAPETITPYGRDLRNVIHPKRKNDILHRLGLEKPYFQVFAQKHGFSSPRRLRMSFFFFGWMTLRRSRP